jgi:hypothetical protein
MQQIYYIVGATDSENYMNMTSWKFFAKYGGNSPKIESAPAFVQQIVDNVLEPWLVVMKKAASAMKIKFIPKVSILGTVSPFDVNSFQDRSIYELISQLCDVGPFNECYVEDVEHGSIIVVRPNQFYCADESPAHDGVAPVWIDIDHEDLVALSVSRSDGAVSNLFWVSTPQQMQSGHITRFEMYDRVNRDIWDIRESYVPALESLYGYRKMEVSSRLLAPDNLNPDAPKKDIVEFEKNKYGFWMQKRCLSLRRQNMDNGQFETGSMTRRSRRGCMSACGATMSFTVSTRCR